jgi:NAD+ diphosphatase
MVKKTEGAKMVDFNWNPDYLEEENYIIALHNREVLINDKKSFYLTEKEIEKNGVNSNNKIFIANKNGRNIFAISLEDQNLKTTQTRNILGYLEKEDFKILTRSFGIVNWLSKNKYCGKCGEKMTFRNNEFYIKCDNCSSIHYPNMSPAIIVGVTKEDKILLAHNKNFPQDRYSILAGFVEWGENFEDTVKREIYEEVKIKVKNIKYFGSQSWPFPNSMMVGFTAEYDSGVITPDGIEIDRADWYDKNNLPPIPGHGSISREIIDSLL